MLDESLKPEADKLNSVAMSIINELQDECQKLAAELDAANENVRKQEKTDARENADLQVARERQAMANHAYVSAQKQLAALTSGIEDYQPKGIIMLGTTVELTLVAINDVAPSIRKTHFIVKIVEHDASDAVNGFIAKDCKVGLELIGKVPGSEVTVKAPMGTLKYKVERIY